MSVNLFSDAFTRADQPLESSADWTERNEGAASFDVVSNEVEILVGSTNIVSYHIPPASITTANYSVSADMINPSTAGANWHGIFGRGADYSTADFDGYVAFNKGTYDDITLHKRESNGWTQLDIANNVITDDTWFNLKLIMDGENISVELDGTPVCSYSDIGGFSYSGYAGLCNGTAASGYGQKYDNFSVDDLSIDTGYKIAVNASASGWVSLGNIYTSNDAWASYAISGTGYSTYVKVYNFDFSAIPDTANILGVYVRVQGHANISSGVRINSIFLLDTSGAAAGDDKGPASYFSTSDANRNFGGSSDLWGNALTPAWVKNSNFGATLRLYNNLAKSYVGYIDFIQMGVVYEIPPTSPSGGVILIAWG
jgi:hypothetical protein